PSSGGQIVPEFWCDLNSAALRQDPPRTSWRLTDGCSLEPSTHRVPESHTQKSSTHIPDLLLEGKSVAPVQAGQSEHRREKRFLRLCPFSHQRSTRTRHCHA